MWICGPTAILQEADGSSIATQRAPKLDSASFCVCAADIEPFVFGAVARCRRFDFSIIGSKMTSNDGRVETTDT